MPGQISTVKIVLIFISVMLGTSTVNCQGYGPAIVSPLVEWVVRKLDETIFGKKDESVTVTCSGSCKVTMDGSITVLKYSSLACLLLYVFLK